MAVVTGTGMGSASLALETSHDVIRIGRRKEEFFSGIMHLTQMGSEGNLAG